MTYNAANRKDIRRAEKAAEAEARQRAAFITQAMQTADGRCWFHDLLCKCRIFSDPFSGDSLYEAYSKGERNIGLNIYNQIVTNCPDQFVTMMKEANIRELANVGHDRESATADESDESDGDAYDPYSTDAERSGSED